MLNPLTIATKGFLANNAISIASKGFIQIISIVVGSKKVMAKMPHKFINYTKFN